MVTREEFYVDSVDGIHMIHGFRWYNTDKAYKGVIQVVHGMLNILRDMMSLPGPWQRMVTL